MIPRRRFGRTRFDVPALGQGTWELEHADRRSAIAALRRGLDLGMTHVDTAEMYGSGTVEEVVAEAIAGRRDEVFLVSKVLPSHGSRRATIAACERSLARLGTDRLDCYLLHWPGSVPLTETIGAFEELRAQGKIRSWGLSNCDVAELEEAHRIAGDRGGAGRGSSTGDEHAGDRRTAGEASVGGRRAAADGRLACNQVLYHLGERGIEHAVLPWCERHGVALVGYSPFGSGRFPGPRSRGGRVLAEIAAAHGATPRQVALAFLVRRPALFAIPKASSPEHVEDNAGAATLRLGADDISRLDAAFPLGRPPRTLPTA